MFIGAGVAVALVVGLVRIEATTSCPSAESVAARLGDLLPAADSAVPSDRARLWEEEGDIVVRLERSDGTLMGTRRLPRTFGCDDLAAAAAVSLAGWESDVHPEFAASLADRARWPAPMTPVVVAPVAVPQAWRVNAGVGLGFGSSVDAAVASDATIGVWLRSPGWRAWWRAELEGQSERRRGVEGGQAAWRRWTLGAGVERPFVAGPDGEAGWLRWFALGRLAWLDLEGRGFSPNRSDAAVDPGAAVGLRAVRGSAGWSLWAELAAAVWPVRHELLVAGTGERGHLPSFESFVRVGVSTPDR